MNEYAQPIYFTSLQDKEMHCTLIVTMEKTTRKPTSYKFYKLSRDVMFLVPADHFKARNIKACLDPEYPSRQIIVMWQQPQKKISISHFEVHLSNLKCAKDVRKCEVEDDKEMKAVFSKLKSNSAYIASVITYKKEYMGLKVVHSEPEFSDALTTSAGD